MKKFFIIISLIMFVLSGLFAEGSMDNSKEESIVDFEALRNRTGIEFENQRRSLDYWKQSKAMVKYVNGPVGFKPEVLINSTSYIYQDIGYTHEFNCIEGTNEIIVKTPDEEKKLSFESQQSISTLEFAISAEPAQSKVTIKFLDGKKNSDVDVYINSIFKSKLSYGNILEIDVPEGNNIVELTSKNKYRSQVSINSNSNNNFLEFETTTILRKIKYVSLVKSDKLIFYKISNIDFVNLETIAMPNDIKNRLEDIDKSEKSKFEEIAKQEQEQIAKEEEAKRVFAQFNKYHGADEYSDSFNNLSNPFYFDKNDGYYFSHVVPVSWESEKIYRAYCIKVGLLTSDQRSTYFYVDIGSYKPSDITKNSIMGTDFGQNLILQRIGEVETYSGKLPLFRLKKIDIGKGMFL